MEGNKSRVTTVVLLGRTGNGKSATGNSLLGRQAFKSGRSSKGVTNTCEMQQAELQDGRILNVVDTPGKGLFDSSGDPDYLGKEIGKCMDFAKDGVHGVILVLSIRSRFSAEEATTLERLKSIFGEKIFNYVVVVFTGGDDLEENNDTLEEYLREIPPELQMLLRDCNHRTVLFNNKTKSETQKAKQATELLKLIDTITDENEGQPYSIEMFREAQEREKLLITQKQLIQSSNGYNKKEEIESLKRELEKQRAEQREFSKMKDEKLRVSTEELEQQLALERSRLQDIEKQDRLAKEEAEQTKRILRENLRKAQQHKVTLRQSTQQLEQQLPSESSDIALKDRSCKAQQKVLLRQSTQLLEQQLPLESSDIAMKDRLRRAEESILTLQENLCEVYQKVVNIKKNPCPIL